MRYFLKCSKCNNVSLEEVYPKKDPVCPNCGSVTIIFLKALSIKQPFAYLILNEFKTLENRNNLKNFKGTFLIHASKQWDDTWTDKCGSGVSVSVIKYGINKIKDTMRFGGIIGYAEITGFTENPETQWFTGKYGLKIKNPNPLPFTPCPGQLSFFIPKIL